MFKPCTFITHVAIAVFFLTACVPWESTNAQGKSSTHGFAPKDYLAHNKHKKVEVLTVGEGIERAYVFIPQSPTPKGAPLVLFHHGWLGMNPKNFGGLIDLIRKGYFKSTDKILFWHTGGTPALFADAYSQILTS